VGRRRGVGEAPGGERAGGGELLTVPQVAGMMRVSRSSVYRLIEAGRLPCVRVGRVVRVPESGVDAYLRQTLPPELA